VVIVVVNVDIVVVVVVIVVFDLSGARMTNFNTKARVIAITVKTIKEMKSILVRR
jgi:hypothetical protein